MTRTFQEGAGARPEEGQKAVFHYTAYNESGSPIDSSYKQDRPAEMRVGASGVIPGKTVDEILPDEPLESHLYCLP